MGLARALGVAAAPSTRSPSPLVLGMVGAVLVGGAVVAWGLGRGDEGAAATSTSVSTGTATSTATATSTSAGTATAEAPATSTATSEATTSASAAPATSTATSAGTATSTATSEATTSASAAPAAVPAPAKEGAPAAAARTASRSPCSGYYYAGRSSPGGAGDTITLGRDARVRADYPRADNGHNAAAPERCVLARGTVIVLSRAPIDASNGHYWVPVGEP
ncbi:MAG: hypothetical protein FJ102_26065 [Deltaproteobacteria bacterium]|nr:hypothetical protein [Deltaproteobacteria bacterium]